MRGNFFSLHDIQTIKILCKVFFSSHSSLFLYSKQIQSYENVLRYLDNSWLVWHNGCKLFFFFSVNFDLRERSFGRDASRAKEQHSFQSTDFDMSGKQNSIESQSVLVPLSTLSFSSSSSSSAAAAAVVTAAVAANCIQHAFGSSIARSIFVWHFMWIKHAFSIISASHTTCFLS